MDNNKEEVGGNYCCDNGNFEENHECLKQPIQPKKEVCKKCINYFQNLGVLPTNIVLGLQENCVLHKNSPQSPVSEEWRESIEGKVESILGCVEVDIVELIRKQRQEAQLKLAEEIMDYMENGLDEPTDWYVSVKNFLSSRGLLPKITE